MALSCCFALQIPKTKPNCIIVRPAPWPTAITYVNGVPTLFNEDYDEVAFKGLITRREFEEIIGSINCSLLGFLPCFLGLTLMYLLAIPTLGLSFLCVWQNFKLAEKEMNDKIRILNKASGYLKLPERGIEIRFVK